MLAIVAVTQSTTKVPPLPSKLSTGPTPISALFATEPESTHPLQSLILMNSRFAIDRAKALAGRLFAEEPSDETARIDLAYRLLLAREPNDRELEQAMAFLDGQAELLLERSDGDPPLASPSPIPAKVEPAEAAAWVDFALAMLNRNEFLYVP
ncbi:DUF1553 domain-containing protein [Tautonia sociabilis]|uniref:DUF1553 domain-containing protein n=1 Tax=Tautonia sociabilis TaxID=2080755 RepID=A0A432MK91_9BACT|nr:DUF1553 domain-containing protein [Tautonia sociabilis]